MTQKLTPGQVLKLRLTPKENAYVATMVLCAATAAICFFTLVQDTTSRQIGISSFVWVVFTAVMFILNRWVGKHIVREYQATHIDPPEGSKS